MSGSSAASVRSGGGAGGGGGGGRARGESASARADAASRGGALLFSDGSLQASPGRDRQSRAHANGVVSASASGQREFERVGFGRRPAAEGRGSATSGGIPSGAEERLEQALMRAVARGPSPAVGAGRGRGSASGASAPTLDMGVMQAGVAAPAQSPSRASHAGSPRSGGAAPVVMTGGVAREHMLMGAMAGAKAAPVGSSSPTAASAAAAAAVSAGGGAAGAPPMLGATAAGFAPGSAQSTAAHLRALNIDPADGQSGEGDAGRRQGRRGRNPLKALPVPVSSGPRAAVGATAAMLASSSAAVAISAARQAYRDRMGASRSDAESRGRASGRADSGERGGSRYGRSRDSAGTRAPPNPDGEAGGGTGSGASNMYWGKGGRGGERAAFDSAGGIAAALRPGGILAPGAANSAAAVALNERGALSFQGPSRSKRGANGAIVASAAEAPARVSGRRGSRGDEDAGAGGPAVRWGGREASAAVLPGPRYGRRGEDSGRAAGPRERYS